MNPNEANFPVDLFSYDAATGIVSRSGKAVGASNGKGYLTARVNGTRVMVHRLAWRLATGAWPVSEIDHINRDRSDNRWENLREASHQENNFNRGKTHNPTGEKNVIYDPNAKQWQVKIKAGPIKIHQRATSRLSATLAAQLIRRTLHGEFAA